MGILVGQELGTETGLQGTQDSAHQYVDNLAVAVGLSGWILASPPGVAITR